MRGEQDDLHWNCQEIWGGKSFAITNNMNGVAFPEEAAPGEIVVGIGGFKYTVTTDSGLQIPIGEYKSTTARTARVVIHYNYFFVMPQENVTIT